MALSKLLVALSWTIENTVNLHNQQYKEEVKNSFHLHY